MPATTASPSRTKLSQGNAVPRLRPVSNWVLNSTSTATALPARTTGDSGWRRVHSVSAGRR